MPAHLVERINASLAAEQAQRAAAMPLGSVSPLVATSRRRHGRLILALAGAAAAVLVGVVVGSSVLSANQLSQDSASTALASTSNAREGSVEAPQGAGAKAAAPAAGPTPDAEGLTLDDSTVQVRLSGTRYTRAEFVTQAGALRSVPAPQAQLRAASSLGPAGTTAWLRECMTAIGAAGTQVVRADVAFYEGQPAVIIVATTNGTPLAYVVVPQCSHTDPTVLRPATPLP
jgi:hypothetical protein